MTTSKLKRKPLQIELQCRLQRQPVSRARVTAWARAACAGRGTGGVIAVRVVGRAEARRLNLLWRGRDYPTNVLSFPTADLQLEPVSKSRGDRSIEPRPLGDLVLCAPVVEREARVQGKTLQAHWAHLIVHGCLHLLGHDHGEPREAERMERRERRVLATFGIADPYQIPATTPETR